MGNDGRAKDGSMRPQVEEVRVVLESICAGFNVSVEQVLSDSRVQKVVRARHACFEVLYRERDMTEAAIGTVFNVTHSTVSRGISDRLEHLRRIAVPAPPDDPSPRALAFAEDSTNEFPFPIENIQQLRFCIRYGVKLKGQEVEVVDLEGWREADGCTNDHESAVADSVVCRCRKLILRDGDWMLCTTWDRLVKTIDSTAEYLQKYGKKPSINT